MSYSGLRKSVQAAAVGLFAVTFGLFTAVPVETLAAPSIALRVVGGGSSAAVDRGTNVDFVVVVTGNGSRGDVALSVPAGLEYIPGTGSGNAAASGSGVRWANADLPDGEVAFTASFRVSRDNACGSTVATQATAAGIGSANASLSVTCGLGGGAGQVPGGGVTAPSQSTPQQPAANDQQPAVIPPPGSTGGTLPPAQAAPPIQPTSPLGGGTGETPMIEAPMATEAEAPAAAAPVTQATTTVRASDVPAGGSAAPSALPAAGGPAFPIGGMAGAGAALSALGWFLRRRIG